MTSDMESNLYFTGDQKWRLPKWALAKVEALEREHRKIREIFDASKEKVSRVSYGFVVLNKKEGNKTNIVAAGYLQPEIANDTVTFNVGDIEDADAGGYVSDGVTFSIIQTRDGGLAVRACATRAIAIIPMASNVIEIHFPQ